MTTMKAAIFKGNGILSVEETAVPEIKKPIDVKLKVIAASICGSDLHALSVPPGQPITWDIVLGHEFYGEIVEKGEDVSEFEIGDHVVVNPAIACGHCFECTHGMEGMCANKIHYGQTIDGGFGQYVVVEKQQLYKVPKDINSDCAAQAEPLSCIVYSLKKINIPEDANVMLYGAGPIGLTFIRLLKYLGVKNLAVSAKGAARIEEAKNCGADLVIDVEKESIPDALAKAWDRKADIVIDAVGTGQILTESMEIMGSGGQILIFGYNLRAQATVCPGLICGKEFSIVGAIGKDFEGALKIVDDPKLGLADLVTKRVTLDEINNAIDELRAKKACRIIVYPNGLE